VTTNYREKNCEKISFELFQVVSSDGGELRAQSVHKTKQNDVKVDIDQVEDYSTQQEQHG